MKLTVKSHLKSLANCLPVPLYAVGGCVRNYILCQDTSTDIDICSTLLPSEFIEYAISGGFNVLCEYKRTGTVVIERDGQKYEYSVTRTEEYSQGGEHTPIKTEFGVDISKDALRRDFKCNAIYYDVKSEQIVDPLNGVGDVKNKVLSTVTDAEEVFSHDGLRLMRLARFSGELGFSVEAKTLMGAKKYAKNIEDISPERIADELKKILLADQKYTFSPKDGHYLALKVLDDTRVLDYVLPELTLGRNMPQRSDFHKYDVLEHSLRCVLYAHQSIRLPALLHDVGKPERFIKTARYYAHAESGEKIAIDILNRYRFDKKTIVQTVKLIKTHMLDLDGKTSEVKVRKFIIQIGELFDKAILLKIADCRAGQDKDFIPPTVTKWQSVYEKMKLDGTPFSISDLKISATELIEIGFKGKNINEELNRLFDLAVTVPSINENTTLRELAIKQIDKIGKV